MASFLGLKMKLETREHKTKFFEKIAMSLSENTLESSGIKFARRHSWSSTHRKNVDGHISTSLTSKA